MTPASEPDQRAAAAFLGRMLVQYGHDLRRLATAPENYPMFLVHDKVMLAFRRCASWLFLSQWDGDYDRESFYLTPHPEPTTGDLDGLGLTDPESWDDTVVVARDSVVRLREFRHLVQEHGPYSETVTAFMNEHRSDATFFRIARDARGFFKALERSIPPEMA